MIREDEVNDELNEIAPGFPLKESFEPPAGYFDSFPADVLNRWKKEESQSLVKKMTWRRIVGIAAVLTGLSLGGWWFFLKPSLSHSNDISVVEAYQYINENIDEFEPLFETSDIELDENQTDIPQDAIEEYLIEEMHGSDPEDVL